MQLLVHVFTLPKRYVKIFHFIWCHIFVLYMNFTLLESSIIQSSDVNHIFLNVYCPIFIYIYIFLHLHLVLAFFFCHVNQFTWQNGHMHTCILASMIFRQQFSQPKTKGINTVTIINKKLINFSTHFRDMGAKIDTLLSFVVFWLIWIYRFSIKLVGIKEIC